MRLFLLTLLASSYAQAHSSLAEQIATIAREAKGKVSVDCTLPRTALACAYHADARPPMQSVFKLPLVITALHLVENGKLNLEQLVRFLPSDRILPKTYSPLQDKYPEANVDLPLRELLRSAVSLSDNTAADITLRVIGGPRVVTDYLLSLGIDGFHLTDGEATLHRDVEAQYRNWFQPRAAVKLLRRLADTSPLTPDHTALLLEWMESSPRGLNRIKGLLPPDTEVFHKTGTSGVDHGLAHATNDIGLIVLPDKRKLAIAIFVTDSRATEATRDSAIARIAKAVYDAATHAGR